MFSTASERKDTSITVKLQKVELFESYIKTSEMEFSHHQLQNQIFIILAIAENK